MLSKLFRKAFITVHKAVYRVTGGRGPFGRFNGNPVLLLTTKGRRSGKARTVPLTYFVHDGAYGVVASNLGATSHPAWYRNIEANRRVVVRLHGRREPMTAEPFCDNRPPELWDRAIEMFPGYEEHQRQVSRTIPVVILRPAH